MFCKKHVCSFLLKYYEYEEEYPYRCAKWQLPTDKSYLLIL